MGLMLLQIGLALCLPSWRALHHHAQEDPKDVLDSKCSAGLQCIRNTRFLLSTTQLTDLSLPVCTDI
jgi:hypothetical protein